jgi:hypothetical protein
VASISVSAEAPERWPTAEILPGRNGPSQPGAQGVQEGRKALRIRHANGMKVRKKRPGGSSERPLNPPISFSLDPPLKRPRGFK